ncbi:hypothetical protein Tco_0704419 [Tanacetum coccineum]|uniref:Uncharacterized protein n=1 Tax=Tanacetum coccineum TaxID=301880 RepID=A0ABQ4Y1S2_9ASTR
MGNLFLDADRLKGLVRLLQLAQLNKGNYCESATEHDQPETEGPVGRLAKRNLQRLYMCQSNVVYGIPPQVLRQILEILNYLATNHSCVADILFYFNSTRGLESLNTGIYDMNDKGKEKVLEGEEIPQPDGLSIECIVHEALESPQYRSSGAAPTPPILEVTVSRPLDPICRIASQPLVPEPPYAPLTPPPLPTSHGIVSPPPLQDVVPSLQPPPPPLMYEAPAPSKISAPPVQVVPPPPARPPPAPPHPPSVYVEPAPPPPPHPFILVLIFFCSLSNSIGTSAGKACLIK